MINNSWEIYVSKTTLQMQPCHLKKRYIKVNSNSIILRIKNFMNKNLNLFK